MQYTRIWTRNKCLQNDESPWCCAARRSTLEEIQKWTTRFFGNFVRADNISASVGLLHAWLA